MPAVYQSVQQSLSGNHTHARTLRCTCVCATYRYGHKCTHTIFPLNDRRENIIIRVLYKGQHFKIEIWVLNLFEVYFFLVCYPELVLRKVIRIYHPPTPSFSSEPKGEIFQCCVPWLSIWKNKSGHAWFLFCVFSHYNIYKVEMHVV